MGLFGRKKKKFGELAVKKGYITQRQLEEALAEQKRFKEKGEVQKRIGSILMEKGALEVDEINTILMEQKQDTFWAYFVSFFSLRRGV